MMNIWFLVGGAAWGGCGTLGVGSMSLGCGLRECLVSSHFQFIFCTTFAVA